MAKNGTPGRFAFISLFLLMLAALLAACDSGGAALSDVKGSTDRITPGSSGIGKPAGALEVSYRLGKATPVTAMLEGPVKATIFTSTGDQASGTHLIRFNGVVGSNEGKGTATLVRRTVPDGDYRIIINAGGSQESVSFTVSGSKQDTPDLQNMVVRPDTISPNSDAVDDVAEATFRTTQTGTLRVDLYDHNGVRTAVLAPERRGPGEQNVVINGQNEVGDPLPDGVYTATVQSTDLAGNRIEASKAITIAAGGQPDIEILSVDFSPTQIIAGNEISVTIKIKNTGKVPLRTQGPDPGYVYTTNDTYASIEGNKWTDKAGLWRVGVDWDGNSGGGGAYRYPFRWGFGKTLMPGEEMVTGGKIRILKQERTMWFFAGVLQEGIRIVRDRLGRTEIGVDF